MMARWAPILLALLIALHGAPAAAQFACASNDVVVETLGKIYGETYRGGGPSGRKARLEIWASDKKPYTWTILKIYPNGLTCIMAVGSGWQAVPPGDPV